MTAAPGQQGQLPHRSGLQPWLVIASAVVLAGLGLLVGVLLARADGGAGGPAAVSTPDAASPPTGHSSGTGRYEGSDDVAQAWVDAMARGEFETAFDLSCAVVQASAAASATDRSDPAYQLGVYFFEQVLGGVGFTGGTLESVEHDAASDTDRVTFALAMDTGETYSLDVHVISDGTVCDFR